jgi:hypothetical protein
MAIESPLFQSAMELLGHSLLHYNGKNELDRKLVILHLCERGGINFKRFTS